LALGSLAIYASDGGFGPVESMSVIADEEGARWSDDGGKTWNEGSGGLPDSLSEELSTTYESAYALDGDQADGKILTLQGRAGTFGSDNDGTYLALKVEDDGKPQYSTDGGKTWSYEPPADADVRVSEDGVTVSGIIGSGEGIVTMSSEARGESN
jgi:hypothetical protein